MDSSIAARIFGVELDASAATVDQAYRTTARRTDPNNGGNRLARKLATGPGETTVMPMLIAWHAVNAVRRPSSKRYTRGFLIVAPGLTIKDRLHVLQSNGPDSCH